ncbi:MAG: aminotransferase class III-fold pyridoxal phosphate-dependent enzyme, partial [Peptococcus niger]
ILDNVQKVGKVLGECLEELAAKHACVGEVRYIGLFSAIDLVKNKETKEPIAEYAVDTTGNQKKVVAKCKELGFYTYGRDNCIQICPPLIITEEELREQMKVLDEVLTWADNEFCK